MSRLAWRTSRTVAVGPHQVPCAEDLPGQANHPGGIRRDYPGMRLVKTIAWPVVCLRDYLVIDGFIEWTVGRWIRQLAQSRADFLEVGCGNMSLRKYLPAGVCYNGFDLSLAEFHLLRVLKASPDVNVALASATAIPLPDNCADLLASTEVLEHIPEIDKAVDEIRRVARPGARFVCSIPNNYGRKYAVKGANREHVNNWTYDEFVACMGNRGFRLVRGLRKGYWIPLPGWLARRMKASYQLPLKPAREYDCTNFFCDFEVQK
jgi:SAM-dependent methyltransferase